MIVSYCWCCCCSIVYLCSLFLEWFVGQLTFHRYFWCVEFTWFTDWFPTVDTLSIWCIGWVSVPAQSEKRKGPIVASYGWHLKVCNFPDGKITPFQKNLNLRERVVLTNLKLSCLFLIAWYTAHSEPYRRKWQTFLTWTCSETPWCFCRSLSGQRWNTQEEVRSSGGHRIGGCVHFHVLRPNKRSAKIVDRYSEYRYVF